MANTREDNDEISFHMLMKSCRKNAGISLELLGRGLYTASMMARVERGEMIPNYAVRNRIMARLGNSSDGYEDFLQPGEYKKYLESLDLINDIEAQKTLEARSKAEKMLKEEECNSVKQQFLYDMISRSAISTKFVETRDYLRKACSCTIDLKEVVKGNYGILAPEECYLLLKLLYYDFLCDSKEQKKILIYYEECKDLLNYIENSVFDALGKAKVYPLGVVILCRIAKELDYRCDMYLVMEKVDNALCYLKAKSRLYYFNELADEIVRIKNSANLINYDYGKFDDVVYLKDKYQKICEEFKVVNRMEYDCYIYRNSDVYCISDVIKRRRKLLGISREKLSISSNCSVKTIMRIENGQVDSQREVLRCIFNELKMDAGYRRSVVLTNDKEIMDEYFRCASTLRNSSNIDLLKETTYDLLGKIDNRYATNKQISCMMINYYICRQRKSSKNELVEKMREALEITLSVPFSDLKGGYLSSAELVLLIGIMKTTDNNSDREIIANYLYQYIVDHAYCGYVYNVGALESVAVWLADAYSDRNMFSETHDVSKKLLLTEIRSHRMVVLHAALFLYIRNQAKQEELGKSKINEVLDFCILLCKFEGNSRHGDYYQKVKEIFAANGDWTSY